MQRKSWITRGIGGVLIASAVWGSGAFAAEPDLTNSVSLASCDCQRGPDGLCRRWLRNDLSWQLYAPDAPGTGPSNDDLERAILDAFGSWQGLSCHVCSAFGTLPALPKDITDTALARPNGDTGCIATACDANPLGLDFSYGGRSAVPLLASNCPAGQSAALCAGAAENSSQIAFLRSDAEWQLSKLVVSTTYLTTAHDGHILDADILLRNTTHVYCYGKCDVAQWDVRAALILELGNAIGLGTAVALSGPPTPETPQPGDGALLPTYVAPKLATCACLAYRYSTHQEFCLPPDTSFSCDAGPQRPLPHAPGDARWLLLLAGLIVGLLVLRHRRQRNGLNSSVPQRRA